MTYRNKQRRDSRRGAVAVEFAAIAPVLLSIVLGLVEVNRIYETQNLLATAAREGARFASMDSDGLLAEGQTGNDKLIDDVKTFLEANGLPRDQIEVSVVDFESPTQEFDIDHPDNDLRLFQVLVSVDYSAVSFVPVESGGDYPLHASVTFRNGRATLSD